MDTLAAALIAVEENAELLKGRAGETGPIGPQGEKGDTGPTGPIGPAGSDGKDGRDGLDGLPGLVWRGPWQENTGYRPRDVVEQGGSSWVALTQTRTRPPGKAWDLVAKRGTDGRDGVRGPQGPSGGGTPGGGEGVSDHGALTGLGDNDHPQYTTDAEAAVIADSAVLTHAAAGNPHPDYLTQAEADALYAATGDYVPQGGPLTENLDADGFGIVNIGSLHAASSIEVQASLDMTDHVVANLADPTNPQDAATKAYVDATDFIPQGGPFTQDLDADGFKLTNLVNGSDPQDAVTVDQFETLAGAISLSFVLVNGNDADSLAIVNLQDPTDPQDAATKASSEAAAATRAPADAAYYVTTASGGLSAEVVVPAFVQTLLDDANAATARTTLGLGTAATTAATDYQPIDSDLTAIAALTTTAFGRALLALADPADATKFLDGTGAFSVPTSGLTQPQVMARMTGA